MAEGAKLGRTHDIYVAFAFAAADVLLETDAQGGVSFAVGASMALLGRPARELVGTALAALITADGRAVLARMLARMAEGERVRNIVLTVARPDGRLVPVALSGYRSPDQPGKLLLAVGHTSCHCPHLEKRVPPAGLHDKDSFRAVASQLIDNARPDEPYLLTLLDLPDLDAFRAEAGSEAAEAFAVELGSRLKSISAGGDAVGQLSDSKFGVVHATNVSADLINEAVSEVSRATAPNAAPPAPRVATLVLDVADLPAEDAARALAYTLNSFTGEADAPEDMMALSATLQPKLSATVRQMKAVRATVEAGSFEMLYQPIVDLWTNVVHHFECLVRFEGERGRSPYETVAFAEDTGLVGMLDLAVVERMIGAMRSGPEAAQPLSFAVNLSGRSLSEPAAVGRLRRLLASAGDLRKRLLFEVTESAEIRDLSAVNAVIQEIRGAGHQVCLDDFGAGAAAFHYLRALKVDHVKIDGSYIQSAMRSNENVSFIKAIVQLCTELGISTTAEFVEDAETANLLKVLKVRYGQGWHFGKPFRPGAGDLRTAWTTPTTEWRKGLLHFRPQPQG